MTWIKTDALLCITIVLIILVYVDSNIHDHKCKSSLLSDDDIHWMPDIDRNTQMVINKCIDNYFKRRTLNKSRRVKIMKTCGTGLVSGGIGGFIASGPVGVIPGAMVSGILNTLNACINHKITVCGHNVSNMA